MDIVSTTPLSIGTLIWQPRAAENVATVIVKMTYSLVHGQFATLAALQEPVHKDIVWDNGPSSSLYAPSDYVPTKPRLDVLLSGHVHAPGGAPVGQLVARFVVDEHVKALVVRDQRPFMRMPIRYPREGETSVFSAMPGTPQIDGPVGFGPWHGRVRAAHVLRGADLLRWAESLDTGASNVAPVEMDWSFFNSAPRDQQISTLRKTPYLLLENLHPTIPRLETWLPEVSPRAFQWSPHAAQPTEIRLRCDTLRIDTDQGRAILTYRGMVPLGQRDERAFGVVGVMLDGAGRTSGMDDLMQRMRERMGSTPSTTSANEEVVDVEPDEEVGASTAMLGAGATTAALPFAKADPGAEVRFDEPAAKAATVDDGDMDEVGGSTLPIVRPAVGRDLPFGTKHAVETNEVGNSTLPVTGAAAGPTLPFVKGESTLAQSLSADVIARLSAMGSSGEAGRSTLPIGGVPSKKALPFGKDAVVPEEPPVVPVVVDDELAVEPVAVAVEVAPPEMIGPLATAEMTTTKVVEPVEEPSSPPVAEPPAPAAPKLLPLALCATIAGERAMSSDPAAVLRGHDVPVEDFTYSSKHWANAIAVDTRRDRFDRLEAYDDAYVAGLERARGRGISVDEYARLEIGMERGEAHVPLSATGLPPDALFRILRVWGRKTMNDRELDAEANAVKARVRRNDE